MLCVAPSLGKYEMLCMVAPPGQYVKMLEAPSLDHCVAICCVCIYDCTELVQSDFDHLELPTTQRFHTTSLHQASAPIL